MIKTTNTWTHVRTLCACNSCYLLRIGTTVVYEYCWISRWQPIQQTYSAYVSMCSFFYQLFRYQRRTEIYKNPALLLHALTLFEYTQRVICAVNAVLPLLMTSWTYYFARNWFQFIVSLFLILWNNAHELQWIYFEWSFNIPKFRFYWKLLACWKR